MYTGVTMQDLHARIEPLLLFFIDGASAIEKDEKWEVLLALQPAQGGKAALTVRSLFCVSSSCICFTCAH